MGIMETSKRTPLQAIILAGGTSRRLGGIPKAGLVMDGQTLLARTVAAVVELGTGCETAAGTQAGIAVVGPIAGITQWLAPTPENTVVVQEDPPYSGPAAGIATGLDALHEAAGHVLILACDMPQAAGVARLLTAGLSGCAGDEGILAVDGGRRQPLAAIYPLQPLRVAVAAARAEDTLHNASVFSLIASVSMKECAVPLGMTADIDTWDDARSHGIRAPQV